MKCKECDEFWSCSKVYDLRKRRPRCEKAKQPSPDLFEWRIQRFAPVDQRWHTICICKDEADAKERIKKWAGDRYRLIRIRKEK